MRQFSRFETQIWHYVKMDQGLGFFLHHGNRLDELVTRLGQQLSQRTALDWFAPETVLIPQPSMRRWVQNALAETLGIAANIDFLPPGHFVNQRLATWLPGGHDQALTPEHLQWRLFALLQDPKHLQSPAFSEVKRYLNGNDPALLAWQMAGELAVVFEKYQAWRRHWLLAWHEKPDPDDWQSLLWHQASQGRPFRAQAVEAYIHAYQRPDCPRPLGLPDRLFVFACQNLSPDVLNILQSFGRWCRVEFFLHNPCQEFWGDISNGHTPVAADCLYENPFLNRWGFAGRDFVSALLLDQSSTWAGEQENYIPADTRPDACLLHRVQNAVLARAALPKLTPAEVCTLSGDDSIQIHACATPLREVQVLRAQLLGLLQRNPGLQWRDIVIMSPDIATYAPLFGPVFSAQDDAYPALPFALSEQEDFREAPLYRLIFELLALPQKRLTGNEGMAVLAHPLPAAHYRLSHEDLQRLHTWLESAGVRWGLNAEHRQRIDGTAQAEFTWQNALDRLLYGYASCDHWLGGVAGVSLPSGKDQALLDTLVDFLDALNAINASLCAPHSPAEWVVVLQSLLDRFIDPEHLQDIDRSAYAVLHQRIIALPEHAKRAELGQSLPLSVVTAYLGAEESTGPGQAWLAGRITVCQMVPMRLIPFKVVCLLGMNEGKFPRQDMASALNRLSLPNANRLPGDRSNRDDDRFLFLQLLSTCQQNLIISYQGENPLDGSRMAPSTLVTDLIEGMHGMLPEDARSVQLHWPVEHALSDYRPATDPRVVQVSTAVPADETPVAYDFSALARPPELPQDIQDAVLTVDDFIRFWRNPTTHLAKRKGIRTPELAALLPEYEPYGKATGLDRYKLIDRLLQQALTYPDLPVDALFERAVAEGLLPPGAPGKERLNRLWLELTPALDALMVDCIAPRYLQIDAVVSGITLSGKLGQYFNPGLITLALHKKKPRGKDWLDAGLRQLLARTSGHVIASHVFTNALHSLPDVGNDAPRRLAVLVDIYRSAQSQLTVFHSEYSHDWYRYKQKQPDADVCQWLQQVQFDEENKRFSTGDALTDYLTYGQGFPALAQAYAYDFDRLACTVFDTLLAASEERHD